jgi:hypothetical protein
MTGMVIDMNESRLNTVVASLATPSAAGAVGLTLGARSADRLTARPPARHLHFTLQAHCLQEDLAREQPPSMVCQEKQRLLSQYGTATSKFAVLVTSLQKELGTLSKDD